MTKTIAGASWLNAPETGTLMTALEATRPGSARFVGGCVRNTLMGRAVDDIDIATQLSPQDVVAALKAANIRAIPTGIAHGTVTAIVDNMPFEITSLRRDVETDGRRAVVAFTQDWTEDAMRRDFRLNAIYANAKGDLYDPTGRGIEDAATGRVVFIGDGDERLREDYLRILRFFRFNAWYGAGIDAEGLAACARQKDGLKQIAAERIWKELNKMLAAPAPMAAVEAMVRSGILEAILPGHRDAGALHDLHLCEILLRRDPDAMQRLMALIPRSPESVNALSVRLKLSNAQADRLRAWAVSDIPEPIATTARQLRKALYQFGKEALIDRAMLSGEDARDLVSACQAWRRPVFPVKGEHLRKAGLKPGPAMGETLRALEDWWIEGDFVADQAACFDELERRLKAD